MIEALHRGHDACCAVITDEHTPLQQLAARRVSGDEAVLIDEAKALLAAGAALNEPEGCPPLIVAIEYGHESLARYLIEQGANINAHTLSGISPLYVAIKMGMSSLAAMLIDRGADVNAHSFFGLRPLHVALMRQDMALLKKLLDHHADIQALYAGYTPLHHAVMTGTPLAIIRLLLDRGADKEALSVDGLTPRALVKASKPLWKNLMDYHTIMAMIN